MHVHLLPEDGRTRSRHTKICMCKYDLVLLSAYLKVLIWYIYIYIYTYTHIHIHIYIHIYRVSQEEGTKLRESVPYVKIYRYNPKHLHPKLNGYWDNGQRKVWSSGGSTHCTLSADSVPHVCPRLPCQITEIPLTLLRQYSNMADYACHV